jgi:hypothetical protein
VQSGSYEVKVSKEGFRTMGETNVAVTINTVSRVNFTMEVGNVTESVNVSAQAQSLQTDRAEVRAELTTKTLTDVPVPGQRNYQALFVTVPGIAMNGTPHSVGSNPSRSMSFSANGVNRAANNTRIDGASATNVWLPHIASYVPALESIETVNIVTNSFDAEQGLAGGAAVTVQVRSGTNDVHGAGFWYSIGNWSQTRPFFQPANQQTPKFVYNQNGGRLGGAFVKNKLFYFCQLLLFTGVDDYITVIIAALLFSPLTKSCAGVEAFQGEIRRSRFRGENFTSARVAQLHPRHPSDGNRGLGSGT